MKVVFVLAVVTSFFADNHALPVGKERQREDVVTKCLVEVLSKALSKPDSPPLDQECKDILRAGPKHAPLEKRSNEEVLTHEDEVKGHEEVPGAEEADVKDIQALLKSVAEKRETPEDERSQESWGLDDEKEKRHHEEEEEEEEEGERAKRIWKPTHRYHHKKHRKRDEELSEEEPDEERSQESWGLDDRKEKRSSGSEEREKRIWKPTHRYHHKKHRKRDEEPSEEVREEPDEERSQESWGLDDDKEKRSSDGDEREKRAWKPTHKYPSKRLRKRDEEASEEVREEPDEERSQESWGLDDDKEKRSSDGDEREKRAWKPTHKYPSKRLRKRDEEASEEVREEPDEERSQESWGLDDKKRSLDGDTREKRIWKPTHRYPNKRLRKRDEEPSEEVREGPGDEERSQESWGLDDDDEKRSLDGDEREKRAWKPTHKYPSKRLRKRDEEPSEEVREEPDEERSQESWGLDDDKEKRAAEEESEEREKRIWKPTHRYHHKKHRKRSGGSEEEEEEEERRSDSGEYEEEKRHQDAEREEALRYLAEKRGEMERHLLAEGEVYDKRSPWANRGYYHPAWWKRSPEGHAVPSHKFEDLARLLSRVRNEAIRHPDEKKRLHQMPLTPEEEKELESLAAMDRELQQIAEKMHAHRSQ